MSPRDALSSLIIICMLISCPAETNCNNSTDRSRDKPTLATSSTTSTSTNESANFPLASTLEPLYFGRYPGRQLHHHHQPQPLDHQHQHRHQQSDFYHHHQQYDPLGNSFYYLKDEPLRNALAKPEFEASGSGGSRGSSGDSDDDIVTLQAFSPSPTSPPTSSGHEDDEAMRLLRMLSPDKQVQLVNNVGQQQQQQQQQQQPERPALSLVSGEVHSPLQSYHRARPIQALPANETGVAFGSLNGVNQLAEVLRKLQEANQQAEQQSAEEPEAEEEPTSDKEQEVVSIQNLVQPQPNSSPTDEDRQFLAGLAKFQQARAAEKAAAESREADAASIPIDRLVDHLMANSRLSSFGVQHDGLTLPDDEEVLGDEDEEDEEEEEEPSDQENQEEAQESVAIASSTRLDPFESSPGFSSVLNKSSSWIPLSAGQKESARRKGKADERRKGKKKRKRKKKRRKRSKKKFGLMIGGRMLSRNDLIRLISILNKMASSKTSSLEEREASRKLLRFLIRLMLEEYKKSKVDDEGEKKNSGPGEDEEKKRDEELAIRDLLRPILEGPADAANKSTNGSIEVRPLVEADKEKEDEPYDKSSEAKDDRNSSGTTNRALKNDTTTAPEAENKKGDGDKRRGLSELSRDLETYFDTDFYEDMADKVVDLQNNGSARPRSASGSTAILAVAAGGRGKPQLLYTMPVPIYGQQFFEAADEDDADLDQVPVARSRRPRKRSSGSRRRRGRFSTPLRAKKRRRNGAEEADKAGGEEEGDGEQTEEEEEQPRQERQPRPGEPVADQTTAAALTDSQDGEEQLDQEPEEPPQASDSDDHGESKLRVKKKKGRDGRKATKNEVNDDEKVGQAKGRRRRRRYRRRKDRDGKLHIDYDHRYDVPAPIVAGKWATSNTKRANGTNKAKKPPVERKKLLSPSGSKSSSKRRVMATTNSTTAASNRPATRRGRANSKRYRIAPKKLPVKSRSTNSKQEAEDETDEPAPGNSGDEDYYNEGTSYSKVCDDENKCKVSVQSSSPKLKKAIKSRDKTKIEQHLSPWLAKGD